MSNKQFYNLIEENGSSTYVFALFAKILCILNTNTSQRKWIIHPKMKIVSPFNQVFFSPVELRRYFEKCFQNILFYCMDKTVA